jgi:hypothetical protein
MFKKIRRWLLRPKNPAGNVYYARLRTPQGTFYKLGYTSKPTLVERMAYGNSGDEKLIDHQFFFTFREDAWDVEQTLLEHFDKHRAFGRFSNDPKMPLSGRGQSELFAYDVLGLDDDLYRQPDNDTLKEIQDEQEEAREGCLLILIGLILVPFTFGISLFFILGGASGLFSKKSQPVLIARTRPVHQPAMQELIDALNFGSN